MRHVIIGLILIVGCAKQEAVAPTPFPVAAAPSAPAAAPSGALGGKVLETLDAPGYTYLRLATASGELWAAIPTATVAVGSEVTLKDAAAMKNFTSKTLGRTFETILFASGVAGSTGAAAAAPAPHPVAAPAAMAPVKVEKAAGANAKTVAELHAGRAALKDQTVVLRGQVVKFSSGIMGKNWVHLRDGTGSDAAKDNDLTVTTTDTAVVGETVVVTGAVHLDRDFGAGYLFPVIIEDGRLSR